MTTYVDVALEEIRKDYPKAFEILKKAVKIKPDYEPFFEGIWLGSDFSSSKIRVENSSEIIINSPYAYEKFSDLPEAPFNGKLVLGDSTYELTNPVILKSGKHQVVIHMEKINGTI